MRNVVGIFGLFLSLLLLAYLVYSQRKLAKRINSLANQMSKEIKGQGAAIRNELGHQYHQVEALEQLLPILKLSSTLPPSRGWAASPDFLLTLSSIVRKKKPKLVLELGSGLSTLVSAKSGAKKIISLDHSIEFGEATREMLKEHKVTGAQIRINELLTYPGGYKWYSPEALIGIKNIDLLVIDGPPSSTNPDARYPALEHLLPLLSKRATVILDDADREDEKKLAHAFADAMPSHKLTFLHHEKGTAVISPR
jgi:predicted O-methyltransferase YrrM